MNAEQAKEKADHIRSNEYQIEKIKEYIGQAAGKGQYNLMLHRIKVDAIREALVADGFKVKDQEQNQGSEKEPKIVLVSEIIWGEEPQAMTVVND